MDQIPPEIQKAIPGAAGSLTALLFFRGEGWRRAVATCIAGMLLARYLGPSAADLMRSSEAVAGYVTGLFGMAVIAKVFDMIVSFDSKQAIADLWGAAVKRLGG
jgi:Na+/H+ antiporter NhaD/arsenite permease-like protein